jgi:hypothetical protein
LLCQKKLVWAPLPPGPLIQALLSRSMTMSGSPAPRIGSTTTGMPTASGVWADAAGTGSARVQKAATTIAPANRMEPCRRMRTEEIKG